MLLPIHVIYFENSHPVIEKTRQCSTETEENAALVFSGDRVQLQLKLC